LKKIEKRKTEEQLEKFKLARSIKSTEKSYSNSESIEVEFKNNFSIVAKL
jgi:hypothetical protein